MREYTVPLALLAVVALCCGLAFYHYSRPIPGTKATSAKLSFDEIKQLDEADRLLELGQATVALQILEPMRRDPLRTRLLRAEAQLLCGTSASEQLTELEKEVGRDRGLDLVFLLARVHEAERDTLKARGLYDELLKAPLRQDLKTRVQNRSFLLALNQKKAEPIMQSLRRNAGLTSLSEDVAARIVPVVAEAGDLTALEQLPGLIATATRRTVRFQFALANAWNSLKSREKATRHLNEVLKVQPDHLPSLYVLFEFSRHAREYEISRDYLQRLLVTGQPLPERRDWDAIFLLHARKAHEAKEHRQAFLFMKQAIFLNRTHLGADIQDIVNTCASWFREHGTPAENDFYRVFMLFVNGEYAAALPAAEQLHKRLSDKVVSTDLEVLMRESRAALEREKAAMIKPVPVASPTKPLVASSSVVVKPASATIDPHRPPADPDESAEITALKQTFRAKTDDPAALLEDAKKLCAAEAWNGAGYYLEAVLKTNPDHQKTQQLLARVHEKLGRHESAVTLLDALLQSEPRDAALRARLARNLLKTRDAARGLKEAKLALELDPNLIEGFVAVGEYYEMRQRPTEALEHVNKGLIKISDSSTEAAQALYALKDRLEKK